MLSWNEVMVPQAEHERRVKDVEQAYWLQVESLSDLSVARWHWRLLNSVGGWLIVAGSRLQARVETAPHMTLESHPPTARPCP